ncbi:MAG: GPP34 family phosphoprotein [Albidovulum sp.]|nr:GPP34 family phosphoprotein [Albidovulum sp.]
MFTFREEILLLALDFDTGWLNADLPGRHTGTALGGAILMHLAHADRVDADVRNLFVVRPEPLGEPVLDDGLRKSPRPGKACQRINGFEHLQNRANPSRIG